MKYWTYSKFSHSCFQTQTGIFLYLASGIINQKTLQQNCSRIIFKENITSTEDTLNDRLSGINSLLFSNLGGILHKQIWTSLAWQWAKHNWRNVKRNEKLIRRGCKLAIRQWKWLAKNLDQSKKIVKCKVGQGKQQNKFWNRCTY